MDWGHSLLCLLITKEFWLSILRYVALSFVAVKALQKWSQGEHPAIQDVLHQTGELEMLLVDSQRDFVGK